MKTQRHIKLFEAFKAAQGRTIAICITSEGGWMGVGTLLQGEERYIEKLESDSVEIQTLPIPATDAGVIVFRGETNTFEFLGSGSVLDLEEGVDFVFPLLIPGKFLCYTAAGHTTDSVITRTSELSEL